MSKQITINGKAVNFISGNEIKQVGSGTSFNLVYEDIKSLGLNVVLVKACEYYKEGINADLKGKGNTLFRVYGKQNTYTLGSTSLVKMMHAFKQSDILLEESAQKDFVTLGHVQRYNNSVKAYQEKCRANKEKAIVGTYETENESEKVNTQKEKDKTK